jgi:hypothetical protein
VANTSQEEVRKLCAATVAADVAKLKRIKEKHLRDDLPPAGISAACTKQVDAM